MTRFPLPFFLLCGLSASLAIAAPKDRTLIEAADPEIDPFRHSLPTLIRVPVKSKADKTAVTNKVTGWMKKGTYAVVEIETKNGKTTRRKLK